MWNGYGATDILKAISKAKDLGIEWGGDWKSFVYKGYGTDTFGETKTVEAPKVEVYHGMVVMVFLEKRQRKLLGLFKNSKEFLLMV